MRTQPVRSLIVMSAVMVLAGDPLGPAPVTLADSASTTLYFLRHGETQRRLVGTGPGTFAEVVRRTGRLRDASQSSEWLDETRWRSGSSITALRDG